MNTSSRYKLNASITFSGLASVMLWSGIARAQSEAPPPADDAAADLQEVLVTGSRIARTGFETPTPVTAIDEEQIQAEAPANIADFVNTLPSVQGSSTAANSSGSLSNGESGISALNLRALGTGRTLVLFDGQRSVVSASTGAVDINTFPQSLIKRVEIVTGGASSAYGSDAIGGVVNFILDKDYTGFKADVNYGETSYGDNENNKISLTFGTGFADGRGHLLLSGEAANENGIHYTVRDWNTRGHFAMLNPDSSDGAPTYYVGDHIGISTYTPGGLITDTALKGTYFGVDGAVNHLAYGNVKGQWMQGGDWKYSTSGMLGTNSLAPDTQRQSVFGRASWNLGGSTEVFAQASYARYEGLSYYINPTTTGITIYADNAFLPSEVADEMSAQGISSFSMGTSNADMPASGSENTRETWRYVLGANGAFDLLDLGFKWDGYLQHGRTETDEDETPTYNSSRLSLATDAVYDGSGNIVCRSTLTDPDNGCVPLNRFGVGVASQEALDYVLGRPERLQHFTQDVGGVNFSTNDIAGWNGPISLAFGVEARWEKMGGSVDEQYQSGWKYGNYKVTSGDYHVAEGYVETLVPVWSTLEFNGAARVTNYSTSGSVTTWKTGLTYDPIPDIKLRLTKSHDIRAPNLSELYAAGTARTNSVSIGDESVSFTQNLEGNPDVKPEEADTLGAGVIFKPGFLPGFAASVDFYDITIDGVITYVTAQDVADYCFVYSVEKYCDRINYDSNGTLQTIDLLYDNLNKMKARGLDIEASYVIDMAQWFDGAGTLTVRGLATHYIDNVTDDGETAVDAAGSNLGSTPDWLYRVSAMYQLQPWMFNVTARGVSAGVISNAYIECTSNCPTVAAPQYTINDNHLPSAIYFDTSMSRDFSMWGSQLQFYMAVKNVLNRDPALTANPSAQGYENTPGYVQTNRSLYDVMGRTFRLGLRMNF